MTTHARATRADYPHLLPIQTRWNDMDKYGHVNNMIYYGYFDTVVTDYLVRNAALDTSDSPAIALVVESHCEYHAALSFPDVIECGLRIGKLGNSSIRYEIGVFGADQPEVAAEGYFVHVFVDRDSRRPCAIPALIKSALTPLVKQADRP